MTGTRERRLSMPSILRPNALRVGDLVAVMALSGGLEQGEASLFARGVEAIEQMGFVVRVSPLVDVDRRWWWSAASPQRWPKSSTVCCGIRRCEPSSR
jgi:hypothetical protein